MAYTPTNWQTGDTITAEKLNHMEDGIFSLSGYDIVFTLDSSLDTPALTASGASFEELSSGDEKKASYIHESGSGKIYLQSISFEQVSALSEPLPLEAQVKFNFYDPSEGSNINIQLTDDTYRYTFASISGEETEIINGTYTYSNGNYVFTPTESGN